MPFPAFIKFHLNGTVLSGRTMKIGELSDVREVWEFDHEVGNGHYEDYGYRKEWAYSHCPLTVITEIGNHVPPLYKSICADENLDKVEIFWPQYKSKEHKEDIYFTHKLWPVKIRSVELFFPNVKDRQFEKYGHLAKIVFRYHWIEWKYVQGNRIFKGEWPSFSTEGMQDDKKRKELEEVENAPMSAEESAFLDYWENKNKKPAQQKQEDLTDSVGVNGKNIPKDVSRVKKRLKELGYPVKDESETLSPEDIKAIKFFQCTVSAIPESGEVKFPDGLISKGQAAEKKLFSSDTAKYVACPKASSKPIDANIQNKITASKNGKNEGLKNIWTHIENIWTNVSPYLPEGTIMSSGYRSKEEQREELYNKYNSTSISEKIIKNHSKDVWEKNKKKQTEKLSDADRDQTDLEMHNQIKEAGGQVALPGKSRHQSGKAIDTQGSTQEKRVRALLWCSVELESPNKISKIINEPKMGNNECVHFEFT